MISVVDPKQKDVQRKSSGNNGCASPQVTNKDKNILLQRWFKQLKLCSEKVIFIFSV